MLDRSTIKKLHEDLEKAVAEVGQKYGLVTTTGTMRFGQRFFRVRVEGRAIEEVPPTSAAPVVSQDAMMESDFRHYATMFGMKPEDLGKRITVDGKSVKIVGLKLQYHKYPIIVEGSQGGRYKLEAGKVVAALKNAQ